METYFIFCGHYDYTILIYFNEKRLKDINFVSFN